MQHNRHVCMGMFVYLNCLLDAVKVNSLNAFIAYNFKKTNATNSLSFYISLLGRQASRHTLYKSLLLFVINIKRREKQRTTKKQHYCLDSIVTFNSFYSNRLLLNM